ncbi:MAG: hypothetical protein M3162_00340 [Thermoproteota archaeon]|nr:hypothetical protein [Thermoproteota archaeon]
MLNNWKDKNISYYEYFKIFLSSKRNLFLVLSIAFFSIIVYPLIIPHLNHPSMIYHIVVHIISFDVALFLTFVSALSFKKTKSKKVFLTCLSFGVLLFVEFLYLLQSSSILGEFHLPYIDVEIPHILLLVMLSLFAIGVLKVEKK